MNELKQIYYIQNDILNAGGDSSDPYAYSPYNEQRERFLQINLCAYSYFTGNTVTLEDVSSFFAEQLKPDGTPKTYLDDETGIVKDLVIWCDRHRSDINGYHDDFTHMLTLYITGHPEFGGVTITTLSLDQIQELEKKLKDPNYDLDLGSVS